MTEPKFVFIDTSAGAPAEGAPGERLISGNPIFRTWNVEERDDGVSSGIWESTPGKWRTSFERWEFCHIITGVSVITEEGGEARTVKAGDNFAIRPGFKGTWEVIETTRKAYVSKV